MYFRKKYPCSFGTFSSMENGVDTDAQPILCQHLVEHDGQRNVYEQHNYHQLLAREPIL